MHSFMDNLLTQAGTITVRAAIALNGRTRAAGAHDTLLPAAGEIAGAASGILTVGAVSDVA